MNAALEPTLEPEPDPVARRLLSADEYQRTGASRSASRSPLGPVLAFPQRS